MLIKEIDARRGLHDKCVELFTDKNIAEQIYCKLCEGIADCEIVSSAERTGKWEHISVVRDRTDAKITDWQQAQCSVCGKWYTTPYLYYVKLDPYCPNCGARMNEVE